MRIQSNWLARAPLRRSMHQALMLLLGEAMYEAYGLMVPVPRSTRHGFYAEAIEDLLVAQAS